MKKNMQKITEFINDLSNQKNTLIITNHFLQDVVSENLRLYLEVMLKIKGKRVLLVGEALGYKGGRITGIPFTSGQILENIPHPVLVSLKSKLKLQNIKAENTATIVWRYLLGKSCTPLFWNAYPYHPHPKGNENKNRSPTNREIKQGVQYLQKLSRIFKPGVIAGIGKAGVDCAKQAFPKTDVQYIRHPSFGGKVEFIKGMNKII